MLFEQAYQYRKSDSLTPTAEGKCSVDKLFNSRKSHRTCLYTPMLVSASKNCEQCPGSHLKIYFQLCAVLFPFDLFSGKVYYHIALHRQARQRPPGKVLEKHEIVKSTADYPKWTETKPNRYAGPKTGCGKNSYFLHTAVYQAARSGTMSYGM